LFSIGNGGRRIASFVCMTIEWAQLRRAFIEDIQREMKRWYPQLLENAWLDAGSTLGLDIAFDLSNPRVQDVLDELLTSEEFLGIASTTINEARALIGKQAENGWSIQQLADELRATGLTRSKTRAVAISHTESARAYSKGAILSYESSGVVSGTEWLIADNACPICQEFVGKVVPLGGEYGPGIQHPPAHSVCRCSLAPVVE
jgi:SPP1 gp7 family putative phage head morphogenesis protein